MDFEDNNPLGVTDVFESRLSSPRVTPPPSSVGTGRIIISEAGKSKEGSTRGHITYTIRIPEGTTVRRRYSEFESFRKLLRRLFPCVVVPPIPEKHSLSAYATNPAHAHEDARIIEHRQRTLGDFLNRCKAIPQIEGSWVLRRFLDPNTSWREVLQSDYIQKLPASPLQAPPVDPTSATVAHSFLPIPSGSAGLTRRLSANKKASTGATKHEHTKPGAKPGAKPGKHSHMERSDNNETGGDDDDDDGDNGNEDEGISTEEASRAAAQAQEFEASEKAAREYENVIGSGLEKRARRVNRHYSALAVEYADLGGQLNSFSLDSHGQFDKFAPAVEKVGQAVDQGYISTTQLVDRLSIEFSEPLAESVQLAATAKQVLKYRRQRELQVQILKDALERQTAELAQLQKAESEAERMNSYLHADDRIRAATKGLSGAAASEDRDHVVDKHGIHDRDHEISNELHRRSNGTGESDDLEDPEEEDEDQNEDQNEEEEDAEEEEEKEEEEFIQPRHQSSRGSSRNVSRNSSRNDSMDVSRTTSRDISHNYSRDSLNDESDDQEGARDESAEDSIDEDTEGLVPKEVPVTAVSTSSSGSKSAGSGLRRGFKLPGLSHINHAIHGMMDVDPQTARRNNITRAQERIQQLKSALEVAEVDSKVAATEVSAEISRYNAARHEDIRQLVRSFVRCHIEWAEKNLESWIEAKQAIANS